mgnify:CR=1 FL=1
MKTGNVPISAKKRENIIFPFQWQLRCSKTHRLLQKVTKMAYAMVSVYGMSDKVGNRSYYDSSGQNTNFTKPYSEATAKIIDEEVSNLIDKAYIRAKDILKSHKNKLVELAELLLEKEVIYIENLERVFGKREWTSFEEEKLNEMDNDANAKKSEKDKNA